jgi:hypothetical protein
MSLDPDPDSQSGSGSRRAKITHKIEKSYKLPQKFVKCYKISCFAGLDVLF